MILNNTLILTLQDFRRHFDFAQFWAKRKHFVRDMHPSKVYYFNAREANCYTLICRWISCEEDQTTTDQIRQEGLLSLSVLSKKDISRKELATVLVSINFSDDIIYIPSGKTINLPGHLVDKDHPYSSSERIHKFEVAGDQGQAHILIGGRHVCDLCVGDCLYITEVKGHYQRLLPNTIERGTTRMRLTNIPGSFGSLLEITRFVMGKHTTKEEGVTQILIAGNKTLFKKDNILTIQNDIHNEN